eukprot:jgi/Chlat1/1923/Chrsp153S02251
MGAGCSARATPSVAEPQKPAGEKPSAEVPPAKQLATNEEVHAEPTRSSAIVHPAESTTVGADADGQAEDERATTSGTSDGPLALAAGVLSIVVFGASGDLAKKKTYPALLALYKTSRLPAKTQIIGYARTTMTDTELRHKLRSSLVPSSATDHGAKLGPSLESFLNCCYYMSGAYDKPEGFADLADMLAEFEKKHGAQSAPRRLFYLALPPSAYREVAAGIKERAMGDESSGGWNRIVLEKPFGRNTESSDELSHALQQLFLEKHLYRIDHFLGKEIVLNLLVLRFANTTFGPLFHRQHVSTVQITMKETLSTTGRAGYFDNYGIIRDIMQNHLMQVLSLLAMEVPATLSADDIRDNKLKVLRQLAPIRVEDTVIGQYTSNPEDPEKTPGYTDEPDVPDGSSTPTFAVCVMYINNDRWSGVPFVMKAAKGVEDNLQVVRIQFKDCANVLFPEVKVHARNELVMRLQPDEAIYTKVNVREPGALGVKILQTELDLTYHGRFQTPYIPQAYERLIYDVIQGDQTHFVRSDELRRAWEIFMPVLTAIDKREMAMHKYPFGTRGPAVADALIQSTGYARSANYSWPGPIGKL